MLDYDLKLKKGFICMLCDFDNEPYLSLEEKFVYFNNDVCLNVVNNTFDYFYYFNTYVWKYINSVNFLAHCTTNMGGTTGKINLDED